MRKTAELDGYRSAYGQDFKFTDENLGMLEAYSSVMCRRLAGKGPLSLLSLGIGHKVVSRGFIDGLGETLRRYVIVEGSTEMIESFRGEVALPGHVEVVHAWFEDYSPDEPFDVIEMGFVLEHVDDPDLIVARYRELLRPGGTLFMAVPNARSLHRLIGHQAGLLDNLYRLSEHDLALGHKRYFDAETFTRLALRHGLKVVSLEGLFLKPLTTAQLGSVGLAPEVWHALYHGGGPYPAIANAVLIEATR